MMRKMIGGMVIGGKDLISHYAIPDVCKRPITSKIVCGIVKAYSHYGKSDKILSSMTYKSVEERRAAIKKLTATWGKSIGYFQIEPK